MRRNLIAIVIFNSAASFNAYLIGYYSKYVPGSFFINYAIIGLADCFATLYALILSKFIPKVTNLIGYLLI